MPEECRTARWKLQLAFGGELLDALQERPQFAPPRDGPTFTRVECRHSSVQWETRHCLSLFEQGRD